MPPYFPEVEAPVVYEGPGSDNPLAFRYYQPDQVVAGKPMRDHLRFALAYWHSFQGTGRDIFGTDVYQRPWNRQSGPMDRAREMMAAVFEFCTKTGIDYYCFHDRDLSPEGAAAKETHRNLEILVEEAKQYQEQTGVRLLWGTANLFGHPRYTHGAATNPDPHVFACAAAEVKATLDATCALGGDN